VQADRDWKVDSTAVHAALIRFLRAFENLDWETFRMSFADDATVFFPIPEPPERATGRPAIEAQFRGVFDHIRRANPGGPPFQSLVPEDLRIERIGRDAVLVTWHFRNAARLARRTILMRRDTVGWRIVHLHASNVPLTHDAP
jgi:ketosteroid isomerase-like protein